MEVDNEFKWNWGFVGLKNDYCDWLGFWGVDFDYWLWKDYGGWIGLLCLN